MFIWLYCVNDAHCKEPDSTSNYAEEYLNPLWSHHAEKTSGDVLVGFGMYFLDMDIVLENSVIESRLFPDYFKLIL